MGANNIDKKIQVDNYRSSVSFEKMEEDGPFSDQIYFNEIPPFVDATLERLYATIYCTLVRLAAYDSLAKVSTYVSRSGATVKTIILFRQEGRDIKVLNQQVTLSAGQITRFCDKVFCELTKAHTVSFYALNCSLHQFRYPFQQNAAVEENIVLLPPTKDAYMTNLRGQFRKQLLRAEENFKNAFPSYEIKHYARNKIPPDVITEILALAKQRTIAKGIADYTGTIDRKALDKTLARYGEVIVGTIDNKVCSGSISFRVDKRSFLTISSYESAYNQYMLGNLIWMAAISRAIDDKCEECWMMGGSAEHKARFRAQRTIFNSITVYRSGLHAVTNWHTYGLHWAKKKRSDVKKYVKAMSGNNSLIGHSFAQVLTLNRTIRSKLNRSSSPKSEE
jgi:hypothetical protein